MRPRVGAGRERELCPTCGREVLVTRSGRLMAHQRPDTGRQCVSAAWRDGHGRA